MADGGVRAVAAFDVDGTITQRDCVRPFLERVGGRRGLVRAVLRRPVATMRAAAGRDRDALKEIVVGGVVGGRSVADVDALGEQFAAGVFAGGLRADTVARLRWHQRRGEVVVLVSASLGPYLRPLGALLGVEAVLCTDAAVAGARYARRLDGVNCRAAEKARRLSVWLDEHQLATDELWAYGDSTGDEAMLAMAAHPVWVDGVAVSSSPDTATPAVRAPAAPGRPHPPTASRTALRSFDAALDAVHDVEGWMSPDQAAELYRAAAATRAGGRIVEIGSFRGRSTIVLASAAPCDVEIVAIDPHAGNDRGPQELDGFVAQAATDHEVFIANLAAAGVGARVRHVRAFSDAAHGAVDGGIDVLFIDGAHRYAPALADVRSWGRRVVPGGTMLIHDSFSSVGVTLAIGRALLFGRRWRFAGRVRSLAVYRADLDGTLGSRLANAVRQLSALPWFVSNLLVKTLLTVGLGGVVERITGRRPEWPY